MTSNSRCSKHFRPLKGQGIGRGSGPSAVETWPAAPTGWCPRLR